MTALRDLVDDQTAQAFEQALEELRDESFPVPSKDVERQLVGDAKYYERGPFSVAGLVYGGDLEEYREVMTSNWSPSTLVYDILDEHGFDPPEGTPYVGVKFYPNDGAVVIEVVLDG